jgi:glycosyltransferase involved in cell wall biosynthesis/ADP-heptose:LPS heptosyltransferase
MKMLFTKTDALGDQLLGSTLCQNIPADVVYWIVREGNEGIAALFEQATVQRPDTQLAPAEAAARLADCRGWVFIPVPLSAYRTWDGGGVAAVAAWYGDFVRALRVDVAVAGTCTLNWVDWFLVLASAAPQRVAIAPGKPAQEIDGALLQYLADRSVLQTFTTLPGVGPLDNELARLAALGTALGLTNYDRTIHIQSLPANLTGDWATENAIIIAPGAGNRQRQWPVASFATIGKSLPSDPVLILVGPADKDAGNDLAQQLRAGGRQPVVLVSGAADIGRLASLLRSARLLLCNDTFILHLAAALGTPTVALFGGGQWGRFVPQQGCVTVVHQPLACVHCDWNCLFDEFVCVTRLDPVVVRQAVTERLQNPTLPVTLRAAPVAVADAAVHDRFQEVRGQLTAEQRLGQGREWVHWLELQIAAKQSAQARVATLAAERAQLQQELAGRTGELADEQQSHARTHDALRREQDRRRNLAGELATEQRHRAVAEAQARQLDEKLGWHKQHAARLHEAHQQEQTRRSQVEAHAQALADEVAAKNEALELLAREAASRPPRPGLLAAMAKPLRVVGREWRLRSPLAHMRRTVARQLAARTVTLVNTHDIIGGAERTSYDLLRGLRGQGWNARLLVGRKLSDNPDVSALQFSALDWRLGRWLRDQLGLTEVVYQSPLRAVRNSPLFCECDVVNVHNMHGRYWNLLTVPLIQRRTPLVLTLHDEYLLTGDCSYSYDCQRWRQSCGRCPQSRSDSITRYPAVGGDLTRLNLWIKRAIFRRAGKYPLQLVTPTRWLAEKVRQSPHLKHLPVWVIPYGIPLDLWRPYPAAETRRQLGLTEGKLTGLFSAANLADRRKGVDLLLEAIRALPDKSAFQFIGMGQVSDEFARSVADLPVRLVGHVRERAEVARYLSASDFTMVISRADNLPYTALESLACGRPVIGTSVGGIPEIVTDPKLGWLLPSPPCAADLARLLGTLPAIPPAEWQARFTACRAAAEARYDWGRMVREYGELFDSLREGAV